MARRHPVLRMARSPVTLLILTAVLLIDWLALPCNNRDKSVAGGWHGCERSTLHGRPVLGGAFRVNGVLIWAFEDDPRLAPPAGAVPMPIRVFVDLVRRDGWWALTRRTRRYFVWDGAGVEMSGAALNEVQQALVAFRQTSGEWFHLDRVMDLVESGQTGEISVLPMGYVHNALSATLALALLGCAVTQARRLVAAWRSSRRVMRDRCSQCGYDLAGLADGAACPECGKPPVEPGPSRERGGSQQPRP